MLSQLPAFLLWPIPSFEAAMARHGLITEGLRFGVPFSEAKPRVSALTTCAPVLAVDDATLRLLFVLWAACIGSSFRKRRILSTPARRPEVRLSASLRVITESWALHFVPSLSGRIAYQPRASSFVHKSALRRRRQFLTVPTILTSITSERAKTKSMPFRTVQSLDF